ncbi:site-specific integrase [Bacillus mycoides]|uniref:site-specific integrase n=1 Tax=Bacillus mycoides TaxID=1405 RepID=UPI001FDC29FA|nr:site-specific integrase [Bacillus mycoides]CAH2465064.1 Pfam:Arm-DNA-bind_4 [Bacillus mycoides KBAB4]
MASFRKRNDKWEYRIRYKEMGKYKETSKGGFKTKKEAQLAAAKVEAKLANGKSLANDNLTFNGFMYEWLNTYKKGSISQGTYIAYEKCVRLHILPVLGDLKLTDLTRIKYQKFINDLLNKLSKKYVQLINSIMHNALEIAVYDFEILDKNPANRIKIIEQKTLTKKEEIKCYDIDELSSFLDYISIKKEWSKYYSLFLFLSRTGLRIGECLALQWDNIDFEKKCLHVNKTLLSTQRNQPIKFGPPKTKGSIRTISIDNSTLLHLRKMKREQEKNKLKLKKHYEDYHFIFTNEDGSTMVHSTIITFLKRTCKNGEFQYITLHGFRHTHAVHLLQSGANIKYVSERLGHSSIHMTANVYLHITKSMEEMSVNQYDSFLKSRGQIVGKQI